MRYIYTHTHTHTHWTIIQTHERRNPLICDNMDRPWGQYAKWNKADTETKYCMISLYVDSKKAEFIETE